MWQSPYAKRRATGAAKKRSKVRLTLKRVHAQLKISDGTQISGDKRGHIVQARIVLNDFGPKGIGVYSPEPIMVGQEVSITIEEPEAFYARGRIMWSQVEESHVISEVPCKYRMGIEFIFETPEEEQSVRSYCDALKKDHMFKKAA